MCAEAGECPRPGQVPASLAADLGAGPALLEPDRLQVVGLLAQGGPGLVQQRAGAGKHITSVDMFTGFTPSSMLGSDNIHPNSTGYKFMADRWYSVIGPLLPE